MSGRGETAALKGDTIRPRLEKPGADLSKILILEGKIILAAPACKIPVILIDSGILREALEQIKPALYNGNN